MASQLRHRRADARRQLSMRRLQLVVLNTPRRCATGRALDALKADDRDLPLITALVLIAVGAGDDFDHHRESGGRGRARCPR